MWWYNHYCTINKLKGKFTSKAYPSPSIMVSCVLAPIPFLTAPPYRRLFYNDHCSSPESGQVLQYQVVESLQRLAIWDQSLIGPIDPRSIMTLIRQYYLTLPLSVILGTRVSPFPHIQWHWSVFFSFMSDETIVHNMEIIAGKCPFSAVSCFEFVMTTLLESIMDG